MTHLYYLEIFLHVQLRSAQPVEESLLIGTREPAGTMSHIPGCCLLAHRFLDTISSQMSSHRSFQSTMRVRQCAWALIKIFCTMLRETLSCRAICACDKPSS